ncbi:MAG: DUF4102 domain-containing protein [Comamonadaceae bacterium]|nr:MAG: DUF4102 domain-containing protein [Comamonadaceae bacterium]
MARPSKSAPVDLSERVTLTAGIIERLTCRTDIKAQAFLRDSEVPGLRVRVTNTGAKSFVFEGKLNRQTIRRTIGDVKAWSIEQARTEARRLAVMIDAGTDPRELDRQQAEEKVVRAQAAAAHAEAEKLAQVTVGEVWAVYLEARKEHWGATHYNDHVKLARAGGKVIKRGTDGRGVTIAMPLHALMGVPLRSLDARTIEAWAANEAKTRATSARLAWRLLKVFLNWCAEQPKYSQVIATQNPAKAKAVREAVGSSKAKRDALQREQLPGWYAAVRQLGNPQHAAYLQGLLLTGARPSEFLNLRWKDVDAKWKALTIRDKVEGERTIPLTPHVAEVIDSLPRVNEWVFASPSGAKEHAGKAMSMPHKQHEKACTVAGIDGLTLHGLRRSFKSLTEWVEAPTGVVAQIMGHKPSATAEKHYTVRPLDLLRMHHERIESWVLQQAGLQTPGEGSNAPPSALRRVK